MNKQILDFFIDLDNKKVEKENNIILLQSSKNKDLGFDKKYRRKINIDGTLAYMKKHPLSKLVFGMASSKMFKSIGVATPQTAPIKDNSSVICTANPSDKILIASQDVLELGNQGIKVILGAKSQEYKKYIATDKRHYKAFKWAMLYDKNGRDIMREFMTDECIDDLITLSTLGELRTDNDGHWGNFFLYKGKNGKKYEGIIPIDLESGIALDYLAQTPSQSFKYFLSSPYTSWTIEENLDTSQNYPTRILRLKKLIENDKLKPAQIQKIKSALEFDFGGTAKTIVDYYNLNDKSLNSEDAVFTYDMLSRLWEYNRNELGKDLGL